MFIYYLKEIDFSKINIKKLIDKLKKKLIFRENENVEIITPHDIIYIKDDEYFKKKINYSNDCSIIENYDNFTLFKQSQRFFYTKEPVYNIPIKHKHLIIKKMKFYLSKESKTCIVIEFCNDVFNDLYFSSDQNENNHSLKDDISYFAQLIV
jgi:hypothetical protein